MGILRSLIQNAKNEGAKEAIQQVAQTAQPVQTTKQQVQQSNAQQPAPIVQPPQSTTVQPTFSAVPAGSYDNKPKPLPVTPVWQQEQKPVQKNEFGIPTPEWQQKPEPEKPFQAAPDEVKGDTISDRVNRGESIYDILKEMGRPVDWEAEKKRAKRERSAALIGDIAGVLGNTIGLAAGARKFAFTPQHTEKANSRIERLLEQERASDIDYFNKKLSAKMQDYKLNMTNEMQQAKLNYKAYQDGLKNDQWSADFKLKVARLDRDLKNDKITQDQWAKKFNETVNQHRVTNSIARQNAATSAKNAETSAKRLENETNGSKNKDYIVLGNDKVEYDKAMTSGIMANVYAKMQEIANTRGIKDFEDATIKFGEGGDQSSKTAAIVKKNISRFPELHGYVKSLINKANYSPDMDLSNILK